jgi:long-chain acyl-CoA synthetase
MNIAGNLENAAFYFPELSAVIDGDREFTYAALNRESDHIASALRALGIHAGDHLALCAPNSYEWLAFYFGTLKAGAVAVTFSHLLKGNELARIMDDCQPRMVFTADEKLEDLKNLRTRAYLDFVVCDSGDISYARLKTKGSGDFITVERRRLDIAAILYTGGTTGTSKGALLSHENIGFSTHNVAYYERANEQDAALCFLPLNHVFAQIHIMHSTLYSGGTLVLQPTFDLDGVLEVIGKHQITKFYAVPTVYIRLLELEDLSDHLASVRYCFSAAASMAMEVVREWKNRTGLAIHEAYGMTESASMVTYNHFYRHVVGSVGTPANLVEVQIRDLDGNEIERGRQGEICIRGPNISRGYLNHPQETAAAFYDDWFRSGDIGYIDSDGYLFIVDRLKDVIITGGENVYPREVEELLYTRPEVQECAVVGLPDREYGERVTAFFVANKGFKIDARGLKAYLKSELAGFKVPKGYIIVDELPKSNAGKLLKREIRKQFGKKP